MRLGPCNIWPQLCNQQTSMHQDEVRRVLPPSVGDFDKGPETHRAFSVLMGGDCSASRAGKLRHCLADPLSPCMMDAAIYRLPSRP